ncbi:MAG TPA: nitroreductase family protein [Pseudonocardia sp.]|jgi:nitroreductase|nr:nitroreductase family protein [Pseudonocardia sp.]
MTLNLTPDELLTTTRSVRKRLDLQREVPIEVIRECLEVARQAPSGSNVQTWQFMIITDADKRAAISEYYLRSYEDYAKSSFYKNRMKQSDEVRVATATRINDSSRYLADHMAEVPVLVLCAIDSGSADLPATNQAGLWGSLLPAAWSFMLAARARGLGSSYTTLHLAYEKEISELLGIPETVHQGALLPTAYYTGDTFRPAQRNPLDEVLHINSW